MGEWIYRFTFSGPQDRRISGISIKVKAALPVTCFRPSILVLFFELEDGGDILLQKVVLLSTNYIA
jgi:hypothetical protein